MGLELELEGWDNTRDNSVLNKHWNILGDSSLRNSGVEFVLKTPKYGYPLEQAIDNMSQYLDSQSFSVSHRCSVHCHIDFRDAEIDKIERFFLLYMLLEPALYTVSSKDRYSNIYCPGLTHTTYALQQAAIHIAAGNIDNLVRSWNKYSGINFCSLATFGSIEIRTHAGTTSGEDIRNWARILNEVYHAACVLSKKEINNLATPEEVVYSVFRDKDLQELMLCENLFIYWNSSCLNRSYFNLIPQLSSHQKDEGDVLSTVSTERVRQIIAGEG
jgi:hypothetical protein